MYDLNKICRTCLSAENTVKSIFSSNTDSTLLFCDMLMALSSVKIEYNDGFPSQICLKCINKIIQAYSFKRECEKSEKILLNYISDMATTTESINCLDIESSDDVTKIENKRYICNKCNKNFATNSSLRKHERTVHRTLETNDKHKIPEGNTLVKCDWCEYVFVSEFTLKKHISSKHRNKEAKIFKSGEEEFYNFLQENDEKKVIAKCGFCNYVFANEDHLKKHLLAKHLNNEYDSSETNKHGTCNLCGIQSKNIQLHINEHYKHLYCTKCSIKFENVDSFEEHIKQKLCKNNSCYLCSVCGKVFNQHSNFKIHSLIHSKEKPYVCTTCNCSFTAPNTLKLHIRTHTNERPYICEKCGVSFKQSNDLTAHKRLHSNERPLQCNVCGKRFNTAGQLNGHKRTHSGEKPYACETCDKRFALSGTLKKHFLTHTGEKPHVCNVCGKQFSQSSTLLCHLKTHE